MKRKRPPTELTAMEARTPKSAIAASVYHSVYTQNSLPNHSATSTTALTTLTSPKLLALSVLGSVAMAAITFLNNSSAALRFALGAFVVTIVGFAAQKIKEHIE